MATLTVVTDDGPDEQEFQKDWVRVLEDYFLPSAATIATGRKWLSILTTGSASTTKSQKWMWGQHQDNLMLPDPRPKPSGLSGLHLITYSLIATVPKSLLSACDQSLPRPDQEVILYYTLVVFMICLVTVTCAFAFIDGTRVLNFSFFPAVLMTRPASDFDAAAIHSFKPFDLNADVTTGKKGSPSFPSADATARDVSNKNGSWTSYLKSKLVSPRRGSTGSSASSVSGDGSKVSSAGGATGAKSGPKGNKSSAKKSSAKGVSAAAAEEAAISSLRRRLNAKTWFETLSNRNREEKETVKIPLPTFEDEFDDQDIQNLKGKKGKASQKVNKKEKESTSPLVPSSSPSSTGTSTASGSSSPIAAAAAAAAAVIASVSSTAASGTPVSPAIREQSSSARTSPKTTQPSCSLSSSSGMGSFELPYNPGKGRRCESLSAVPSDAFSNNGSYKESPASDFGFWDPDNTSSKSSVDNNMEIWDSPITMFDPQKALLDLSKKQAPSSSSGGRNRGAGGEKKHQEPGSGGVSKSALCAFPPNPNAGFPAVGLFDASLVHRQVQTPSPRGWSPSHKSLQASMSVPVSSDANVNRTTPSPIAVTTWEPEKDVLSRLRESSTDWIRGPTRVTTPVQRPQNGSMWPDAAPGGGRVPEKTNGFWSNAAEAKMQSEGSPSSSWNPLSGGSGFSLFGRSLWSPIPPPPPPGMSPVTQDSMWTSPEERRN